MLFLVFLCSFCTPFPFTFRSYRFVDLFPDTQVVRDMQKELDTLIEIGIVKLITLLMNSDAGRNKIIYYFFIYVIDYFIYVNV